MSWKGRPRAGSLPMERANEVRRGVYFRFDRGDQWGHGHKFHIFDLRPRFQFCGSEHVVYSKGWIAADTRLGFWKRMSGRDKAERICKLGNAYQLCMEQLDSGSWPENLIKKMQTLRAELFQLGWPPHYIDRPAKRKRVRNF